MMMPITNIPTVPPIIPTIEATAIPASVFVETMRSCHHTSIGSGCSAEHQHESEDDERDRRGDSDDERDRAARIGLGDVRRGRRRRGRGVTHRRPIANMCSRT